MSNILALAGLLLVIFSIPLPFQKTIYLSTIYPCDLIFGLIFSAWLAYTIIIGGLDGLEGKKVFLFFLPFMAAGAISIINAKDLFRFAGYMYLWSQMPLAYIMAVNIIKNKKYLNMVLYSILAVTALFSLFYIFDYSRYGHFLGLAQETQVIISTII